MENAQSSGHNWVRFQLEGSSRDAVGAIVEIKAGGITQRRMVNAARSYLSQGELAVQFGLGEFKAINSTIVRWPDGTEQTIDSVKLNELNQIRQPESR